MSTLRGTLPPTGWPVQITADAHAILSASGIINVYSHPRRPYRKIRVLGYQGNAVTGGGISLSLVREGQQVEIVGASDTATVTLNASGTLRLSTASVTFNSKTSVTFEAQGIGTSLARWQEIARAVVL